MTYGGVGARKKRNWIFKTCKVPSPFPPNWTNEVSLGLRLCHLKSCLGMLHTYRNYLMESGLRQSWMENFYTHPPLKRQLPNLQGNRLWYLSLTALPVDDISPWKKTEHTLLGSFWNVFLWLLFYRFWGKDTTKHTCTWTAGETCQVPFAQENNIQLWRLFSSCTEECAVSRHQLCRALAPELLVVLFIRISIFHSCYGPAASVWQQVTKMLQVLLWTPGQAPPCRTKPVP